MSAKPRESVPALMKRFATNKGEWDKESLSDAIYWVKLLLSIVVGLCIGIFGIRGFLGNILFIISVIVGVELYVSKVLHVDIEGQFGSPTAVMMMGLLQSYAAFVLAWSLVYTALY